MEQNEWNAGKSSAGDAWSNLKKVVAELTGPFFWILLCGAVLVTIGIQSVSMARDVLNATLGENDVIYPGALVVGWLIGGTVLFSLLGTGRRIVHEDIVTPGFFATVFDVFRRGPRAFAAVGLVTVAPGIVLYLSGFVLRGFSHFIVICLFSLVAFYAHTPILYVVITRDDLSFTDAFREGIGWLKRHLASFCISFALLTLAWFAVIACLLTVFVLNFGLAFFSRRYLNALQAFGLGELPALVALLSSVGLVVLQLVAFAVLATTFYEIEVTESTEALRRHVDETE